MLAHRDAILASGGLTEPEFDETLRFLDDPDALVLTPVLYAAWGRKPESFEPAQNARATVAS
jgi:hypothetical protein